MGKHINPKMDNEMIEAIAKEVNRIDHDNPVLQKYMKMENFEGSELRKVIK